MRFVFDGYIMDNFNKSLLLILFHDNIFLQSALEKLLCKTNKRTKRKVAKDFKRKELMSDMATSSQLQIMMFAIKIL